MRGDVPRIARKNVLERADRSLCATLLAKDHADVEVGRDQLRRESQRSLISAQRETAPMQHLERHALVVVRLAVCRRQLERVLECLPSRASAALRKPRLSERAPQRYLIRRERDSFDAELAGRPRPSILPIQVGQRNTRFWIGRRCGERGFECLLRVAALPAVAQKHAEQMLGWRIVGLFRQHLAIAGDRRIHVARLMRGNRRAPRDGEIRGSTCARCRKRQLSRARLAEHSFQLQPMPRQRRPIASRERGQRMHRERSGVCTRKPGIGP